LDVDEAGGHQQPLDGRSLVGPDLQHQPAVGPDPVARPVDHLADRGEPVPAGEDGVGRLPLAHRGVDVG
jgi:hypothetical protein